MCPKCNNLICKDCLEALLNKEEVICPFCEREEIEKFVYLKKYNKIYEYLVEGYKVFKTNKKLLTEKEEEIKLLQKEIDNLNPPPINNYEECQYHKKDTLYLYCYQCQKIFCETCCLQDNPHKDHTTIEYSQKLRIQELLDDYKLKIDEKIQLKKIEGKIKLIESTKNQLVNYLDNLKKLVIEKSDDAIEKIKKIKKDLEMKEKNYQNLKSSYIIFKPRSYESFISHNKRYIENKIEVNLDFLKKSQFNKEIKFFDEFDVLQANKDLKNIQNIKMIFDIIDENNKITFLNYGEKKK